jgi:hypothetical protein
MNSKQGTVIAMNPKASPMRP